MVQLIAAFLLFNFLIMASPVIAQDYLRPGGWYEVMYVKFKPICARRALEIVYGHFARVDQTVGRRVIPFDFSTGEWDHVVFFPIAMTEEGYDTIPPRSDWWSALSDQEGGREQAETLFGEFLDCIAEGKRELARLGLEAPGSDDG
jgi:hypothetical protein